MEGDNEIILIGKYKDFETGVRFDLNGKNNLQAANALCEVAKIIWKPAFVFSGINYGQVRKLVDADSAKSGAGKNKTLSDCADFIENFPKLKERLLETTGNTPNPNLLPAAEACFMNTILASYGFDNLPQLPSNTNVSAEKQIPEDTTAFIGNFNRWICIKKINTEGAADYEIGGLFSSICDTIVSKAHELAGHSPNEKLIAEVVKGKRKGWQNLISMLRELSEKIKPDNEGRLTLMMAMESIGFYSRPSLFVLQKAYPDLKPKKPKGRAPKN